MTKVAPTLLEKCEELANAYETELKEKEAESSDAERVVKLRQAELETIRKQTAELLAMNENLNDDEADRAQEEELRMLVAEGRATKTVHVDAAAEDNRTR
jgi:uncharacterized HAD superfamily protein